MEHKVNFDKDLIQRYDVAGPRYTSYPTAVQFSEDYSADDYLNWVSQSNQDPIPSPLSLYLHIPFCDTICYYCGCSKVVTKDHDKAGHYIDLLKREIAMQGKLFDNDRQVIQIHWGGGTPTFLDDRQIYDIISCLNENFNIATGDELEAGIEVDPRTVDHERIRNLRNLGFNRISFGVQDFDAAVQAAVNRVQEPAEIRQRIEDARKFGFESINIDLMYGLPKQTLESFRQTLETTIELDPDRIAIYNYAHMPELFKPQRRIEESDLPSPDEKLNILQLAIDTLQDVGYHYIGMDHFAKQDDKLVQAQQHGTLQRNFQGYSTSAQCDIVAMGVTAISRIGDNFGQNVRSIEEYEKRLDAGQIPIFRGIELEADDVLRGEIISELMCNNRLDIDKIESRWHIDFRAYFKPALENLKGMADDGLIKLGKHRITLTGKGRLLARAICMQFDRYLKPTQQSAEVRRFSRVI
jgi:oxygen-independent coproporphyrinogen-3 oxidase